MDTCQKCGHVVNGTSKFCPECGAPVLKTESEPELCPVCGAECRSGSKFCKQCGALVAPEPEISVAISDDVSEDETEVLRSSEATSAEHAASDFFDCGRRIVSWMLGIASDSLCFLSA